MAVSRTVAGKLLFAQLVVFTLLSCSLFTPGSTPVPSQPAATSQAAHNTPVSAPKAARPTAAPTRPTATAVQVSADAISVDYTYTSELITVIYPLYGKILDDFLTAVITNSNPEPARVVVESEIVGYTDKAIDTVTVGTNESVEVRQNPRLAPGSIDQLNVQKPANFHLRVVYLQDGEEKIILDQTNETLVYARRDFPWEVSGMSQHEDFELLAAMVTPNDPAVEALIRAAAEHTESGTMWNGYGGQVNDEDGGVWERLEALWAAEADDYQLTYISTMVSYAPGDVQRIRLPAEVLDQRSGNCIELALLFASAAEALELETALIRIPGHAYMAVRIDPENADYYVIETTMIGRADFAAAVNKGSEEFQDALPHLDAGEALYDWVTVAQAREKGILPLPWH